MAKKKTKFSIKSQTILKTPFMLLLCNHSFFFFNFFIPNNVLVKTTTATTQRKGISSLSALVPSSCRRSICCQRGETLEGDPEQDTLVEQRAIFASLQVQPYLLGTIPWALTSDRTDMSHPQRTTGLTDTPYNLLLYGRYLCETSLLGQYFRLQKD